MSTVRNFHVRSRVSLLALGDGGVTVHEALKKADAAIESVRESCLVTIDATLAEIDRRYGVEAGGGAKEPLQDLYNLSSQIIDLAMGLPGSGIDEAARALCELIDRSVNAGVRDRDAILVHIEALKLLRSTGQALSAEQRQKVLQGLRDVTVKRVGTVDGAAQA